MTEENKIEEKIEEKKEKEKMKVRTYFSDGYYFIDYLENRNSSYYNESKGHYENYANCFGIKEERENYIKSHNLEVIPEISQYSYDRLVREYELLKRKLQANVKDKDAIVREVIKKLGIKEPHDRFSKSLARMNTDDLIILNDKINWENEENDKAK